MDEKELKDLKGMLILMFCLGMFGFVDAIFFQPELIIETGVFMETPVYKKSRYSNDEFKNLNNPEVTYQFGYIVGVLKKSNQTNQLYS